MVRKILFSVCSLCNFSRTFSSRAAGDRWRQWSSFVAIQAIETLELFRDIHLNIQFDAFFLTIFQKGNSWKKIYLKSLFSRNKCIRWDWVANRLVIDWNRFELEGGYVYERLFFPFITVCNAKIYIIKFETAYYNKLELVIEFVATFVVKGYRCYERQFCKIVAWRFAPCLSPVRTCNFLP